MRVVIATRYRSGSGFDRGNAVRGGKIERVGANGEDVRNVVDVVYPAGFGFGAGGGHEGCRRMVNWSPRVRETLLRRSR